MTKAEELVQKHFDHRPWVEYEAYSAQWRAQWAINEALEWAKEQALSMKYLSACSHAQEMAEMIANAILAGKSEAKS